MKLIKIVAGLCAATMFSLSVYAQDINAQIKTNLQRVGLKVESIKPSKMANLYEAFTDQGLFYTSADGKFLIQGKLYQMSDEGINSLTEESLSAERVAGMEQFKESMIVFPAKEEKYQVTVFTDLTCGYCRRLHEQVDTFNELGITVRYLAFPRGGIASQGYRDIRSVWCSEDQQTAMTTAKAGKQVDKKVCNQPVAEQYDFGKKVGVTGTPAIMLDDGLMIPGYKSAEDMHEILQMYSARKG
ncbi:bifunctional protein-disulfide isomerase/oxidoreductase DsbC [Thalassotalea maritima]|uniref:bifunctional protein-disulfide isomerase/oxidoreductase DsbC n=1 Tax=Thalassotalea maritima TaxID=3242416 RepID=UPI00352706FC